MHITNLEVVPIRIVNTDWSLKETTDPDQERRVFAFSFDNETDSNNPAVPLFEVPYPYQVESVIVAPFQDASYPYSDFTSLNIGFILFYGEGDEGLTNISDIFWRAIVPYQGFNMHGVRSYTFGSMHIRGVFPTYPFEFVFPRVFVQPGKSTYFRVWRSTYNSLSFFHLTVFVRKIIS